MVVGVGGAEPGRKEGLDSGGSSFEGTLPVCIGATVAMVVLSLAVKGVVEDPGEHGGGVGGGVLAG